MSYRAGVGQRLAQRFTVAMTTPHIVCDGCGVRKSVETRQSFAAKWFLNGRAAPGWRMCRAEDGSRIDQCPECKRAGP